MAIRQSTTATWNNDIAKALYSMKKGAICSLMAFY